MTKKNISILTFSLLAVLVLPLIGCGLAVAASEPIAAEDAELKERIKAIIRTEPAYIHEVLQHYLNANRTKLKALGIFEKSLANRVPWKVDEKSPQKGSADAPVTILQYTDFQCAPCAQAAQAMEEIMAAHPEKVRWVFKNYPEGDYAPAVHAARAGLAAHRQGKFWEYHDRLFQKDTALNDRILRNHAKALGLDMERFVKDRDSDETTEAVAADSEEAAAYGITGPPGFVINGVVVNGLYPAEYFTVLIDYLLEEMKQE
jgi:protein-disulfide isomerase